MILTVNHLGFDCEGLLADTLNRLGLPMASWFVDSPAFILGPAKRPNCDFFTFCWDRDYLPTLKQMGYHPVHYLPLASDPELFFPKAKQSDNQIAFVGDSLKAATEKYLALSGLNHQDLPTIDRLALNFLNNSNLTPGPDFEGLEQNLTYERKINLEALITWRASRIWRRQILSAMPKDRLIINGDDGWKELLSRIKLQGRLDYYKALPAHYRSKAINLNITSAQMKTGLNQRVFDVPACQAFLLTDRRNQLDELFDPDEVVTYHNPQEAAEKAKWYLKRPEQRAKVSQKAYQRVLAEHLYLHRLEKMIRIIMGVNP
jgi:spore maturation protein CgeB